MVSQIPKQSGLAPLIVLIIVGTLGLGSTATIVASDQAKPGEFLFPVDTAVENLRLTLATNPENQVDLRTEFAAERVTEIEALLAARGVDAPGLDVALANLTTHKAAVAQLVAQKSELKVRARILDSFFEEQEKALGQAIKAAKRPLKQEKERLEVELLAAVAQGDTTRVDALQTQITQIKVKLDALEAQEEATEDALEIEEQKLEAQFEAEEKLLEEKEEALEEEEERVDDQIDESEKLRKETKKLEEKQEKLEE